jgi:hypothetical protein
MASAMDAPSLRSQPVRHLGEDTICDLGSGNVAFGLGHSVTAGRELSKTTGRSPRPGSGSWH